jgi:hypothetical protein
MINLKKLITENDISDFIESFDLNKPSDSVVNTFKNLGGKNIPFEVDGLKYKLEINLSMIYNDKVAEIKFYLLNNPKMPKKSDFMNNIQYNIALKKSQLGITGTGNSFKVLKEVLSLLKYYIDTENIKYLTFTADEENRQKLYKSILQKLIKKYNIPYFEIFKNPLTGDEIGSEEFWLEKN